MTQTEINKVLTDLCSLPGETEIVEFKEAKNGFDFGKLGKYFSALSNEANLKRAKEAWIVFGIGDRKRNIIGSNFRAGNRPYLDSLKGEIASKTTNRTTFIEIYELTQPEGRVVLFQVPAAPQGLPIAWEGHYYGRDGEELVPLNLEKIERIRRQTLNFDWSAEVYPGSSIADIDDEKIDNFLHLAQAKRGFPLNPGTSTEKVLSHLQLIHSGEICRAALLAFGKKPQRFFTTAITKCAHFHGYDVRKPIPDHKVFHGDVFEQVTNAKDFVLSKISLSVGMRDKSIQAPIEYEIPQPVIAEAIVNAIAHRDYTSNASVQVMLFIDRLGIFNPGDLTPKLSISDLKINHASFPTNPKLAELMYLAGYIEGYGTGTGEIYRLAQETGLKEPEFEIAGGFNITIWRPSRVITEQAPDKYPASTPQVGQQQGNSRATVGQQQGNSREIDSLVLIMDGEMKRAQIQELLGLKHKVKFLKNYIQPSINEGFIELTIPDKPNSPRQSYRLTEKGLELQKKLREQSS